MKTISLDQLANVTGGAAKKAAAPAKSTLQKRTVGNTTLVGNKQTPTDMFWEVKPF